MNSASKSITIDDKPGNRSKTAMQLLGIGIAGATIVYLARKFLHQDRLPDLRQNRLPEKASTPAAPNRRDDMLKDTFPASDAPASQYFDIPANRR